MDAMALPSLLVTGFGPFERVDVNPSGEVARALAGDPGLATVVLPTTFRGSAEALDAALEALDEPPVAIVCIGVHSRGCTAPRLERRARSKLRTGRPDVVGETGDVVSGAMGGGAGDLETDLDLERLLELLRSAGAPDVEISEDAGGFVCERIYRHALVRGAERGFPALFLHVPPAAVLPVERQVSLVRTLLEGVRAMLG